MKGISFALVPVRASDPATIADELRSMFAAGQEGPMAGIAQLLPQQAARLCPRDFTAARLSRARRKGAPLYAINCRSPLA